MKHLLYIFSLLLVISLLQPGTSFAAFPLAGIQNKHHPPGDSTTSKKVTIVPPSERKS